ncbi:TIGR01777 family oxidoreductase [Taibaiella koreensis]|uniref:TIGR01777 family oxidoreductase n=1 Tax=Taibaiella koreensis TaxID=1268548 RepID=UPI000E59FE86|nr:TIGR01777 family oxidoreductase [Taibaiella koreensis]
MSVVLITGGTGTVGRRLTSLLVSKGYQVIVLSRGDGENRVPGIRYARWDIERGEIDQDAIADSDYVIHLAGAGVAEKRWTQARKQVILDSRTHSSRLLADALKAIPNRVKAVISASASGYYGADTLLSLNDGFTWDDPPADDFLAQVCRQWEESIAPVKDLGKRLVILRTGIVLSRDGGALKEFVRPLRFRVAAILGSGRQIVSWIHEDDLCRMYLHALENEAAEDAYNAVAPHPVTNRQLVTALAKAKGGFYIPLQVPAFALRLALGEMATEVLKSARLSSDRIEEEGFTFAYPDIAAAAAELLGRR